MQSFMITLLTCSVTISALALFYMAITPLLAKRYSEKGRYYAWIIVVIGLIIPFRPQFSNAFVKVAMPSGMAAPSIQVGNGTPVTVPIGNAALPSALPGILWWQIAAAIWLAGVIVFLAYHVIKHCCFVKMVKRWSENIMGEQSFILLQSLKSEMKIPKQMNLYRCSSIGSPMMIGFINPRILLPRTDFAQDELRFILKHELIHYKRKDLWYKTLVLLATAIHWFNPIVYQMVKAIDIQCELSCDAETVRSTDTDTRQHYSETIIGVVKYKSKLKTALSTNFNGGKKGMKKRIFSIMDTSKKKAGIAILGCALFLVWGTGIAFAVNASNTGIVDYTKQESPNNDINVIEGKDFNKLTKEDKIEVTTEELADYQLYTNSTKITVTIPKGDYKGVFRLYDVRYDSDIQELILNQNNRTGSFSGLTSSTNYYVVASEIDSSAIVTITD